MLAEVDEESQTEIRYLEVVVDLGSVLIGQVSSSLTIPVMPVSYSCY